MASFPLVSATGMLGSGYREDSLDKAVALGARMIGCDAGSTDPGPGPLATGTCMFSKAAVKRDTEIMLTRAVDAGIPLVIGSSGTGGGDAGLDFMRDIVREIARERGLRFKLAAIHSELSQDTVREHLRAGKARPLPPSAPLTEDDIDASLHIVGMMGVEPIQAGRQGRRAGRRRRPQQRHLDLCRPAIARGPRPGGGLAHGEDPRMRRRGGGASGRAGLHDGGRQ